MKFGVYYPNRFSFSKSLYLDYMKRLIFFLSTLIVTLTALCQSNSRQRNTIYVLDCTKSMVGFNGSPDIWDSTKNFLKSELDKEARENPNAKVTVLPFQGQVHHPISIDLSNINWPRMSTVLDQYVQKVTPTNICDAWLTAEKYIDPTCENYIVLLTDGQDNVNPQSRLQEIFKGFCGKYHNTKGFYVELTAGATLSAEVQHAIDICNDLFVVDAKDGIPEFGSYSEDILNINTRDLPTDYLLVFSNSGSFRATIENAENPYVSFSIKDDKIRQGKMILHVESKHGENIETLNTVIGAPTADLSIAIQSSEVIITNPDLEVLLHTTPLRSLDINVDDDGFVSSSIERVKPFMWVKGNDVDTLRWNLMPHFNDAAIEDESSALFKLSSNRAINENSILFNGTPLGNNSIIAIRSNEPAVVELLIAQDEADNTIDLSLTEVNSSNLDRFNGVRPDGVRLNLKGEYNTSMSIVEIIFCIILTAIVIFLILWFAIIRNQKYPKFKKGIINIQSPYYASIRVKGYRMVVLCPNAKPQGWFDRLWRGKILYHKNPSWPCAVEITPSGKNMRFRCPSGQLISDPTPSWTKNCEYKILDPSSPTLKFDININ